MIEPKFIELVSIFERVADWEKVCPFLIVDKDGQKTKEIKNNSGDVDVKRQAMLREFLQRSNASWKNVVNALRIGTYTNLADEIEKRYQK